TDRWRWPAWSTGHRASPRGRGAFPLERTRPPEALMRSAGLTTQSSCPRQFLGLNTPVSSCRLPRTSGHAWAREDAAPAVVVPRGARLLSLGEEVDPLEAERARDGMADAGEPGVVRALSSR